MPDQPKTGVIPFTMGPPRLVESFFKASPSAAPAPGARYMIRFDSDAVFSDDGLRAVAGVACATEGPSNRYSLRLKTEADMLLERPLGPSDDRGLYKHLVFALLLAPFAASAVCSAYRRAGSSLDFERCLLTSLDGKKVVSNPKMAVGEAFLDAPLAPPPRTAAGPAFRARRFDRFTEFDLKLQALRLTRSSLEVDPGHALSPMPPLRGGPLRVAAEPAPVGRQDRLLAWNVSMEVGGPAPLPFLFAAAARVEYAADVPVIEPLRPVMGREQALWAAYPLLADELMGSLRRAALPPLGVPGDFMNLALPRPFGGGPLLVPAPPPPSGGTAS